MGLGLGLARAAVARAFQLLNGRQAVRKMLQESFTQVAGNKRNARNELKYPVLVVLIELSNNTEQYAL
jgi:hypothetical protein